jgi:hypothetical protein
MMGRFGKVAALNIALAALFLVFATIPGCGGGGGGGALVQPDDGQYGSVLNFEEFDTAPHALPVEALLVPPLPPLLPTKALLTNAPAVSMQGTPGHLGSPGTCEAQSFGYGLGSYTAARSPDGAILWDAELPGNEVSAAFQFALAVEKGFATCPKGGQATEYLSRLIAFGSPSAADVPYEPSCDYFNHIDLAKVYPNATRLRIGSFATFHIEMPTALGRIKGYLTNGQAVAFSGRVLKNYGRAPILTDGVLYETEIMPKSGHGQVLVGYDDKLGKPGKTGALLVQNSFGTAWPPASAGKSPAPPGKVYWSYHSFLTTQKLAAVAYPRDPSPPSGTILDASVATAPAASITRAFQWAPAGGSDVFLIFLHQFADPVQITSLGIKEPAPGKETAVAAYGQFISTGYTYLQRSDGHEFLPGDYDLKFQATLADGTNVIYSGMIAVGDAQPTTPPSAGMSAAGPILDTVGQVVLLTP